MFDLLYISTEKRGHIEYRISSLEDLSLLLKRIVQRDLGEKRFDIQYVLISIEESLKGRLRELTERSSLS